MVDIMSLEFINEFTGQYDWLSNFYPSPIVKDDLTYPTVEHFYQSMKMVDKKDAEFIRLINLPGRAKNLAKALPMRHDWNNHLKYDIMSEGLLLKFTQNPELGKRLIATGDTVLVEGNRWHDNLWGSCICDACQKNISHNILGRKLMELRTILSEKV